MPPLLTVPALPPPFVNSMSSEQGGKGDCVNTFLWQHPDFSPDPKLTPTTASQPHRSDSHLWSRGVLVLVCPVWHLESSHGWFRNSTRPPLGEKQEWPEESSWHERRWALRLGRERMPGWAVSCGQGDLSISLKTTQVASHTTAAAQ